MNTACASQRSRPLLQSQLLFMLAACLILLFYRPVHAETVSPPTAKSASDEEIVYRTTFGRADDIDILLKKGADVNAKNEQGWSVLAIASDRTDAEAVKLVASLLKGGANPNLFDPATKNYPILNAVKNDQPAIVKLLIDAGADYKVKDASGKTLIEYASARGNKEVIGYIQAKLDAEAAAAAALRSPERLRKLADDYGFSSCAYQYYVFYLRSGQNPERDAATQKLVDQYKARLQYASGEMRTYYPFVKKAFYDGISTPATKLVYDELQGMVSNAIRRSKGIGSPEDVTRRCTRILKNLKITIPANLVTPDGQ